MMCNSDNRAELFEDIYAKHYKTVYKYVLVSLGFDNSMTDDCMQDIFVLLLHKADKIVAHPNPGGFFIVTARNYIKKYQTANMNNLEREIALDENIPALSYEENFEKIFERDANIEILKKEILKQLDSNELSLYKMFYETRLSISEISKNLHISDGNVRVRLYRLRIKVKKMVQELFAY